MQTIHLDISNMGIIPTIYAKQGDVGRKFRAVITDNGEAYDIPVDALLSVWYSGTSGEGNYSMIGEDSAFSIDRNTVTVELITQMLTNHGSGNVCLVMNRQDGTQIGTWNIPYIVEQLPGMGSSAAEQYFTALTEAAAKASESAAKAAEAAATFETDATLSVAGQAADAAATGAALAGKAPVALGAPHNYLDNSDFRNPVNQRGQTSYIPAVDKTYRIDRWYTNEARTIELLSNGIEIGLSQNGTLGGLSQRLEHFAVGDIVTFAVQDSEGNRYVTTCALTDDVNAWADVGNGVFLRAICLGGDGIFTIGVSGSSKTFVWAALYEGEYTAETLPEYKPKGYAVELAECLRYYQKDVRVNAMHTRGDYFAISYMHRMRTTPTVIPRRFDFYGAGSVEDFDGSEFGVDSTQLQFAYLPTVTSSSHWQGGSRGALTADFDANL